jgi:hypothetical protein
MWFGHENTSGFGKSGNHCFLALTWNLPD